MLGGRWSRAGLALVVAGRPGDAALATGGEGEGAVGAAAGVAAAAPVCRLRRSK